MVRQRTRPGDGQPVRPPADDDPVGALLVRTARGDEPAFAELYEHVAPRVYGLCVRVLRDPGQAEEVSQEVLLELWRRAARYQPDRGTGLVWVLTVAHRRAVDRVRSAQARTDREERAAATATPRGGDEVAEQVTIRMEHQQVRRCLRALTELQRQAVTLAYYHGRTYREVAELLGVPLPTIKSRMRDALIRLRDCLAVAR
ncbi:ECF RNA polymerase sigma factor SigK [Actinocatenispora comari]|uniref:RNA polymerase sigma factor SigK n=1 Tax=Actinocatenispora comari TaxID=2807577 RepID=A0A8J4AAU2_9ACTN|nr:RNA polymerase sigma factor SigK [Actinocatenispora comari]